MNNVKGFMALAAVVLLSSCVTTTKTARTASTSATIKNATVADLRVSDKRVTYTMSPSKAIQRAGLSNVKQAAIQEALAAGDKVALIGFGTFSVNERPAREGINPQSKEKIKIAAKKVAKFKAGAELAKAL